MTAKILGSVTLVAFLVGCGTDPGAEGSASGDFSSTYVHVSGGALEIVLTNGDGACDSRTARKKFNAKEGLRIRLLIVDKKGDLSLSDAQTMAATEIYGPRPHGMEAVNEFAATYVPSREVGESPDYMQTPVPTSGSVTLDEAPDYDTGDVSGEYKVEINGQTYEGTFETAYCPTADEDKAESLGQDFYNYCSLAPSMPYAPDSSEETTERDITRGMMAWGLFGGEAECMQGHTNTYCKGSFPQSWTDNLTHTDCFYYEIAECTGEPGGAAAHPDICAE